MGTNSMQCFLLTCISTVLVFNSVSTQKSLEEVLKEKKGIQKKRLKESRVLQENLQDSVVIDELKKEGFIPHYATIVKTLQHDENRLIFLHGRNNNKDYESVVKIAPNPSEHKKLIKELNLVQFANDLSKKNKDTNLPIIIEPRGGFVMGGKTIFVLGKAKGIPLKGFPLRIYLLTTFYP